jgi:hypothetical protein
MGSNTMGLLANRARRHSLGLALAPRLGVPLGPSGTVMLLQPARISVD